MLVKETSAGARRLRGRRLLQLGGAALVGVSMALVASGTALADVAKGHVTSQDGVRIAYTDGDKVEGETASRLALEIEGKTVPVYCIDLHTGTGDGVEYAEAPWTSANVPGLERIQWVITNSYPTVTPAKVAASAGANVTGIDNERLLKLVYAATQAAVWHFSDEIDLGTHQQAVEKKKNDSDVPSAAQYAVITTIYTHLVQKAGDNAGKPEPKPTLKISPETATGSVGGKAGPFTVTTGGGEVTLTVTGGKAVDKDGKAVTTVKNGDQFWLTTEAAGTVKVEASGSGQVPTGRVFIAPNEGKDKFQKLILAGVAGEKLAASASATFTETPTLPVTGASVTGAIVAGLVLLAAGGFALVTVRRRRIRFTA